MADRLERVPEPAIMCREEELEFIKCNSYLYPDIHPLIADFLKRCPNFGGKVRMLDVGCGIGTMSMEFVRNFPYLEVISVEASALMLQYSKAFSEVVGKVHDFTNRVSVRLAWLPDADFGEPEF